MESTIDGKTVLSASDIQKMGFCRSMAYHLLNRSDMPVVVIGGRKFLHRQLFEDWLRAQASGAKEA